MKKVQYIMSLSAISAALFVQSCQQPAADQATIDAKVTEAYNAEKMKVENDAATACEDAINSKVKSIQDSMSTLSLAQQKLALEKAQRELKAAQAKIAAASAAKKKKELVDAKKKTEEKANSSKPTGNTKPVINQQGNQVGTAEGRTESPQNQIKKDAQGNQIGTAEGR